MHDLVFASLCNQHRLSEAFGVVKGRNLLEQSAAVFSRVIADQFAPGSPGDWFALGDKRIQFRWGVHRQTASEPVRSRQRRERRIAAIRPAPEAYAPARRDALFDGPVSGVNQIVLHLAAPLAHARLLHFSPESVRAAKLDPQRREAAIRQQL